ncbi:MAG: TonB-dependent receptor [Hellea sp.]|nr:TonB-dependent receptor [Hellea sp.]
MASRLTILAVTTALSASLSLPSVAQTAEDEVIVTATKRPETIFDVPVPVTAVSGEELDKAQIRDISDLQNSAPSLTFNQSTGASTSVFAIRGIGTAGQNTGLEQSVGVIIDGVHRGRPGSALGDYIDIEQVEVLRGPQGTIFGKNTSAGVVNVRTSKPSFDRRVKADVSVGNYNLKQIRAAYSDGLSDELAFSLAGSYQNRDGYVENLNDGGSLNDRDRWTLRGQILWEPSDDFSLRVIGDVSEMDEVCCAATPILNGPAAAAVQANGGQILSGTAGMIGPYSGTIVDIDNRQVSLNTDTQKLSDPIKDKGVSAEAEWDLGGMTATAIGAYRTFEYIPLTEGDFTNLDMFTASNRQDLNEKSLELRLSSDGVQDVDWLIGGFYSDQHIDALNILEFGTDTRAYFDDLLPVVFGQPVLNLVENNQMVPRGTFAADGVASADSFDYNAESFAVFGNATWHATDQLDLSIGARYTDESKQADYNINATDPFSQVDLRTIFGGLFIGIRQLQIAPAVVPFDVDYSDDDFSVTGSLSYEFSPDYNAYFRYAQGYKSGGFNLTRTGPNTIAGVPDRVSNYDALVAIDPSLTPTQSLRDAVTFQPEQAETFELGLKTRWLDRKVKLDMAFFLQELENFQANSFNGTVFTIRNAGSVEGHGAELDYSVQFSDRWNYTGSASFQDIKYKTFTAAGPTQAQISAGQSVQNLTGQKPNFISDVSLTGNMTYELPVTNKHNLLARGAYRYRSEYNTAQDLDPVAQQPSFWTFDTSLALVPEDSFWSFEVWAKNITNETVQNIVFDAPLQAGSFAGFFEPPRTYGATLRLNWD